MKCMNCNINIGAEFKAAILHNKCPACDNEIMLAEKLASFLSLQNLLKTNFDNLDVEKIASLIIANFDLKQVFKEELQKTKSELPAKIEKDEKVVNEDDINDVSDAEYKKQQMEDAKKILKDMRDQVMNEALADQWGLGNANPMTEEEDIRNYVENEKRKQTHENIVTGTRGAFRRSE